MKCFERLVIAHINTMIPDPLDPLQFPYHSNEFTDDSISIALHNALTHLDKRNTYLRMLFSPLQAQDPGTEHLPLHLNPVLPDGTTRGGEGRQQHIRPADHQHMGPSGLCA